MSVLSIDKLTKIYRRGFWGRTHQALYELSLEVEEREIFGFLGANGAGKTTTFKILMGLAFPTSGTARILGRDISAKGVRRAVGFLPEDAYFYTYLTARELLVFYGRLQGLSRREIAGRADGILDTVGLSHARGVRLGEFSKGMRQRFGIAQAIVNDPSVLFLDEPLTGLDPLGRKGLKDLILSLRDQGKTVFFSSHILSDAEAICDRVAVLAKGRLTALGHLGDLLQSRIRSFDLRVSGLDADGITALGLPPENVKTDGAAVTLQLSGEEDPDEWIASLRAGGGKIEALIPYRQSLEEFFVATADGETDSAGSASPPVEESP